MEEVIRRLLECRGWVCCHSVKSITAFDLKIQALKIKYDTDLCNMEIRFNASMFVVALCLFLVQVCTCCQWKSAEIEQLMFDTYYLSKIPGFVEHLSRNCCPCQAL